MSQLPPDKYMLPVEEALNRILAKIPVMDIEEIEIRYATGRILREDICATRSQPPSDGSAMDGYAYSHADQNETGKTHFKIIGEAPAGKPFEKKLSAGEAIRIFTGGAMPQGADTVIMQENTKVSEDGLILTINESQVFARHVRKKGNDFNKGDVLLKAGRRLSPRDIGVIAMANVSKIRVSKKPTIALLSTGDELQMPGEAKNESEIVNSNSPMLAGLIEKAGGIALELGIARDNKASIIEKVSGFKDADMLITIGGASVGDYDIVAPTLEELGFVVDFWKIAMRPGKPVIFGELDGKPVLGLPGNPVSAMVGGALFLVPILDRYLNCHQSSLKEIKAFSNSDIKENGNRQAYLRAQLSYSSDGKIMVQNMTSQDSAALLSFSNSDGLIIRPIGSPAISKGTLVSVLVFKDF